MLNQQPKNSPNTTGQSWYTPNKHKNISAIETNPSMNVAQFQSNQYSSIELSQSLAESPSFFSPNKQLASFLMTPNYSSKHMLPSGSDSIGEMRLRTESLVETSRFYELAGQSKKAQPDTGSDEAKELMQLINKIREIKSRKIQHSRKLNEELAIQSFLVKELSQKEQNILGHKLVVEEKIQQKNKLQKKLKQKKTRIKAKTKNIINDLTTQINKLKQQLYATCTLLSLDQMAVGRCQNQLYHINTYMRQHGIQSNSPFFFGSNNAANQMLQSKAEQLNYQSIPGFYSNPSSSRSQCNTKRSNEQILRSGQQRSADSSNFSLQDLLKNHLSSMMVKEQPNEQKSRKFSFGQFPSFCMENLQHKNGSGKQSTQEISSNVSTNNGNFIMPNLAMRLNQCPLQNSKDNPQTISPQKKFIQNPGPLFMQQFDNISPIAASKRVRFSKQIEAQIQIRQKLSDNNQSSTNKKDIGQIIEQLDGKQDQSQCEIQFYNESAIDINENPMVQSRHKNSPRLNFNRKQSQSPQHKRTQSGQTAKMSIKLPLVLQQSIVQIACQSSTCSENLQYHDFSPMRQEEVKRRVRSPTHQVMPAIHEEMQDLRKTDNKLKGSNKQGGSSKQSGGAETPIFRSQASEQQLNLGFSRPFLGGSMKQSQVIQKQANVSETSKSIEKGRQTPQINSQQRVYRTKLLSESKKGQPYSIYKTQIMQTIQTDQPNAIEQKVQQSDDDFYSCTLKTQSKVFVQSTIKSRELNESDIKNKQNEQQIQSSKSRYMKDNDTGKDVNLVFENVKNKNYNMGLNLSEIGNKNYDTNQKRTSLELKKKGVLVEFYQFSDCSNEKHSRQVSERANSHQMSTL